MQARAVHFVAPRRVELREVELPEVSDGLLLVATEWSGISSGTELLAYRGEVDPDLPLDETMGALAGTFTHPFRYGYSAVAARPAGRPFREGAAGLRLPPPSGPVRGRRSAARRQDHPAHCHRTASDQSCLPCDPRASRG